MRSKAKPENLRKTRPKSAPAKHRRTAPTSKGRDLLKIGVSASFSHADPQRPLFKGKTLLTLEESLAHWIQSAGALPFLIPSFCPVADLDPALLADTLDALLLQGGADLAPESYGEKPLRPEWAGDPQRDAYESKLVAAFLKKKKPILGICRGHQFLNVFFGGSLYQDVILLVPGALEHRNWDSYDQNIHQVKLSPKSALSRMYPEVRTARVNSIHHQAIKTLGRGLKKEAVCLEDGLVEAFRHEGPSYVVGIQWHPEFHPKAETGLLDAAPILEDFISHVRARKNKNR